MSTVVYRDGVLAGDTLVIQGTTKVGLMDKIWKTNDGYLCGAVGDANCIAAFRHWTEGGMKGDFTGGEAGAFDALIVQPDGKLMVIGDKDPQPYKLAAVIYAIGSGSDLAMGAMAVGADAQTALQAALMNDINTGGPGQIAKLDSRLAADAQAEVLANAKADAAAEAKEKATTNDNVVQLNGAQAPADNPSA